MFFEITSDGHNTLKLDNCCTLGVIEDKLYLAYLFDKDSHYDWFKNNLLKFVSYENLVLFIGNLIVFRQIYKGKTTVGDFCSITLEKTSCSYSISSITFSYKDRINFSTHKALRSRLQNIYNWYVVAIDNDFMGVATSTVSSIRLANKIDKIRFSRELPDIFNECIVGDYFSYLSKYSSCIAQMKIPSGGIKSIVDLDKLPKFSDFVSHNNPKEHEQDIEIDLWSLPSCGVYKPRKYVPDMGIKKIIFHEPATIVYWKDGTKTVVKCNPEDSFDPEKGVFVAMLKKIGESDYSGWLDQIKPYIEKYYKKK